MSRQIPVTPPGQPPRPACLGGCLLLFLPFALGVIVLVLFLAENDPPSGDLPTTSALLAALDEQIRMGELAVIVQLAVSVGGERALTLDASTLDTIQDEYFCVQRPGTERMTRVCIPYTNITGITYPQP